MWVRALELATHLARGEAEGASGIADWLVEAARTHGSRQTGPSRCSRPPLPPGSPPPNRSRRARSSPRSSRRPAHVTTPYYARQLAAMRADRARRRRPRPRRAARRRARAPLSRSASTPSAPPAPSSPKHAGDHAEAAALYAEAAARWQEFGNVPEHAHALLGQGRCLLALGDPAAEQPLREAAELFSSMGYRPALAETNALQKIATPAA